MWVNLSQRLASLIVGLHTGDEFASPRSFAPGLFTSSAGWVLLLRRLEEEASQSSTLRRVAATPEHLSDAARNVLDSFSPENATFAAFITHRRRQPPDDNIAARNRASTDPSQVALDFVLSTSYQILADFGPKIGGISVATAGTLLADMERLSDQIQHYPSTVESWLSGLSRTEVDSQISMNELQTCLDSQIPIVDEYLEVPSAPPSDPEHVIRFLSEPRMRPYLSAMGTASGALKLYRWNIEISSEAYRGLHLVEVALRNAIDRALIPWNKNRTGSPDWLITPDPDIERALPWIPNLQRDASRSRGPGYQLQHCDILSKATFATWKQLLPRNSRKGGVAKALWNQAIKNGFPNSTKDPDGYALSEHIEQLSRLRNRIAHLEPVLNRAALRLNYKRMRAVLTAIDPALEEWFTSTQQITTVLKSKPRRP